ncbi:uncharacterized protein LOC111616144 [Centruroides sculpturatus]|uniref:uncharacterized protein LOC111616144 n=1 Tax=Centruroides sculpturatus TaxID=218467 RepID=UPI000C6E07B8|nr:uncharacterized protein LOC111616144 [Centruroides sculpturatus]
MVTNKLLLLLLLLQRPSIDSQEEITTESKILDFESAGSSSPSHQLHIHNVIAPSSNYESKQSVPNLSSSLQAIQVGSRFLVSTVVDENYENTLSSQVSAMSKDSGMGTSVQVICFFIYQIILNEYIID